MVNTKPEHDLRLAVMHETSSDDAETQISSWLKSFDDVEFVKKRNQMRDTVFVSTKSADEALDDIMSSEMGADSAPEKVKLSIIDYSTHSESLGVNTEYELIVKPIGAVKIEGNVDSYYDDALELFEGSLMMPDTDAPGDSEDHATDTDVADAEEAAENDGGSSVAELSDESENDTHATSDNKDTEFSESEGSGSTLYDGHGVSDNDSDSDSGETGDAVDEGAFASEEDRQRAVLAEFQRSSQDEMQKLIAEDATADAAGADVADFADSRQDNQAVSGFADSRASSLELTFDESDIPEFAESSELDSESDLERGDRLTFALDNIIPHVKNDVLFGDVVFDETRLSQLSPQSRLSLEMSINQANRLLDNSRIDAESEAESVTNEELRDEVFSAIGHFSESSDENVDAYADAYAEAVAFANAIQNAADEIVDEYNAREDAWVAKQIDALRDIYRQNNPDRTGDAIDALIEKNTPKYAELESAANTVRPAAVAAVVRFLRKKNTKTSDAASELTRFSESRKIASAQLEESFRTLQGIDASNGFSFSGSDAPGVARVGSERSDEKRFVPVSELGAPDEDAPSDNRANELSDADGAQDATVQDDASSSSAVSELADGEDESNDDVVEASGGADESDNEESAEGDDADGDDLVDNEESAEGDDAEAEGESNETRNDDPMSDAELDESLKLNDDDTGEVSDFDEEEAAELPKDFMDDDASGEVDESGTNKPSKKVIAIAAACAVGLIGVGTLFTGFVWPGFFKSDDAQVTQDAGPEGASATLPSGADDSSEQEPTDESGLYRTGDTIRVVVRGSIQNLTVSEFTQGGGAIAENTSGDKFRITQTQLDRYSDENPEQFEGREAPSDQAPAEPEGQPAENNDDLNDDENAPDEESGEEQSEDGA